MQKLISFCGLIQYNTENNAVFNFYLIIEHFYHNFSIHYAALFIFIHSSCHEGETQAVQQAFFFSLKVCFQDWYIFFLGIIKLILGSGQVTKNSKNLNSKRVVSVQRSDGLARERTMLGQAIDPYAVLELFLGALQSGKWLLSNHLDLL